VDELGTAHFAQERIDSRYQLFFRAGKRYDPRDFGSVPHGASMPPERLRTLIDISPGMKAVARRLRASATAAGLDFELLQAVIATESGFDAAVVSPRGAIGLMQLTPETARRFGVVADPLRPWTVQLADPAVNIRVGSQYLRYLVGLYPGRIELALAAYNAGAGAVQRAGNRIPDYPETQNYVKTVMQLYLSLKAAGNQRAAPLRVRMEAPALPEYLAQTSTASAFADPPAPPLSAPQPFAYPGF
jgi:hypothetical protein